MINEMITFSKFKHVCDFGTVGLAAVYAEIAPRVTWDAFVARATAFGAFLYVILKLYRLWKNKNST